MGIIRPATPGFLVTLIATALLAVVSFNVPILKSIFFLKATITESGQTGTITLGTLGYCLDLNGNQTCSKPSVGYQIDINALLDNTTKIKIPEVLVKWVTYALVLHIVALVLAGISAVFGLLAHVREMSMTYCSTCVSGFSAAVAMVAFIFDIVLFFLTRTRVNDSGGHAEIGMALWLTLAAWILLFFAGCFYGLGRCCIRRRPRGPDREAVRPTMDNGYAEQMRLEAVKAEADRKARQAAGKNEIGLPAFQEYERQPLTSKVDENEHYIEDGDSVVPYHAQARSGGAGVGAGTAAYARQGNQQPAYTGGYAQATPGTRAVDAYYNSAPTAPARQGSTHTQAPSAVYSDPYAPSIAPSATAGATAGGYLAANAYGQYGHQQQPSGVSGYGHMPQQTSFHSAVSHQRDNTGYNAEDDYSNVVDPFAAQPSQTRFQPDTYNTSSYMYGQTSTPPPANAAAVAGTNPYRTTPERNYTLGGGGYGANVVPALDYGRGSPAPTATTSVYSSGSAPHTINTSISPPPMPQPASPRGPRDPTPSMHQAVTQSPIHEEPQYPDAPPMYDAATSQPPGQWGAKH
ncbi:pali-domain-containing protein [Dichomitus squalens LYAD-421 SS1]|uniref:pali-domain-containing protein n=1 Tax=Dichomitus squalens (strain LYAD-421) TaxID=732165 RepID=UPI00044152D5|nr:pali-domain-containing protein [Dichomitus squalens LYAD-421 SS1]EJF66811.1 pali-domain-containing protein [Dichomitus squalens LYAD-421 SS1]